ncbi:MAG: histidine kinase [Clostridia bacterium]|nr:histidine kinase [Clostridia bacterium]
MDRTRQTICRILLMLLSAVLITVGWTGHALCAAAEQAINASGNRNIRLCVDPIRRVEGYSAILYNILNGLPTSEANAIAQTDDGFIWVGSYAGLIRYDGNTFQRMDPGAGIANVRCLFIDSRGQLWIGTNDSGVFLKPREEIRKLDQTADSGLVSIRSIAEGADGDVWIGAASGIGYFDADMDLTVLRDERIAGKTIREIRSGSDGLIYGLTLDGDLFTAKDGALESFISRDECRVSGIVSILPDPAMPGFVYLGTEDARVCHGELARNLAAMGVKDVSPLSGVERLEPIDGDIWICAGNGIGRLDAEGFHRLKNVPMNSGVEHVMTDLEGNLWFTSSKQGVMKIVPNRFIDCSNQYDLPEAVVNAVCVAGRRLYIGTDDGLMVVENGKRIDALPLTGAVTVAGTPIAADDLLAYLDGVRIRSIICDSRERLWISTWHRHGLVRYDHGQIVVFTPGDGLFSDRVRIVAECEDGTILVANTGGISVIRDDRITSGYGEAEGIAVTEILTVEEGFDHEWILGSDGGGIYVVGPDGTKHIGIREGLKSEVILRIRKSRSRDVYWIVTSNSLAYMTPDHRVTTIEQFPYSNNYDLYENDAGDVWVLSSNGVYVASAEALIADGPIDIQYYGISSGLPYTATSNSFSEMTSDGDLYIAGLKGVVRVDTEDTFKGGGSLWIALPGIDVDGRQIYPDDSGGFSIPHDARKLTISPYVISFSLNDPQVSYRLDGLDPSDITVSRSALAPVSYTNLREGTYRFVIRADDPVGGGSVTASWQIIKEKVLSAGASGTIIMDVMTLFLLGGILIYTSPYRKRGRLDDRLFFGMALVNIALAVSELSSYLLETGSASAARILMYAENTVFFAMVVFFPYLFLLYLDHRLHHDRARLRRLKLLYGIPCALFFILLIVNLKSGWIFSITQKNAYRSGPVDQLVFVPILFYFLVALTRAYRINPRLALLGVLLILSRIVWDIWYIDISSTAFMYTIFLVSAHVHVMNRSMLNEETP